MGSSRTSHTLPGANCGLIYHIYRSLSGFLKFGAVARHDRRSQSVRAREVFQSLRSKVFAVPHKFSATEQSRHLVHLVRYFGRTRCRANDRRFREYKSQKFQSYTINNPTKISKFETHALSRQFSPNKILDCKTMTTVETLAFETFQSSMKKIESSYRRRQNSDPPRAAHRRSPVRRRLSSPHLERRTVRIPGISSCSRGNRLHRSL